MALHNSTQPTTNYYTTDTSPYTCKRKRTSSEVGNQSGTLFSLIHMLSCTRTILSICFSSLCLIWKYCREARRFAEKITANCKEDKTVKKWLRREERKGDLYTFQHFFTPLTPGIFQHIPSSFLETHLLLIQIHTIHLL